ncbi:MAG: hypothetical protein DI535_09145 [Citrobacter freundii]|nr:MAG: hypothetical protein DI535_09145 [Citrobacter freundii]
MKNLPLLIGFQLFSAAVFAQCALPAGDFDGDGIPDAIDLDDDNDGFRICRRMVMERPTGPRRS